MKTNLAKKRTVKLYSEYVIQKISKSEEWCFQNKWIEAA